MALANDTVDKTLIVGSEEEFPPFAIGHTDETAGGFTVDLWREVAKEAGLKYAIRVMPWGQILQEFKEGKIDVLINIAQSEERHLYTDFSVPHVTVNGAIFVRKDESRIHSEADLTGKSIIVFKSDLAHEYAISRGWQKQLIVVDTPQNGLKLLASSHHDVMLLSKLTGVQTLKELEIKNIKVLDAKTGYSQKFSFGVHSGDSKLLARLNEGLAITKADGDFDAIYNKWFGVYEVKTPTFRDMLPYIASVVTFFLIIGGYFYWMRRIERKKSVEELQESRATLDQVLNTVPQSIFWKDLKGRYLGCNRVFATSAGLDDPARIVGKTDFDLPWLREEAEAYRADDREVIEKKITKLHIIEQQQRADGGRFWVDTCKMQLLDANGCPVGVLGIFDDITERKQNDEALRISEERFRLAIQATNDGLWEWDIITNQEFFSPRWCEIIGYSSDDPELLHTYNSWAERIHPDDHDRVLEALTGHLEIRTRYDVEYRHRHKSGEYRWQSSFGEALFDENGKPTKMVGCISDINDRKQAEVELQKKNAEMEQFIYTVSHDLRSPLVTVKTFMGYLEKDMAEDNQEHLAQDIQFIHGAADKMKLLLDELLEMSRIGRVELAPVRVSFRELIAEARDVLAGVISERKVDIHLADTDLMLFGDRSRLCQIWHNLIENAIKYSHNDRAPRIEIGVQQENGETVFFVKDNGIGVDPQFHSKIFGIFEKLDPKSPGAGLGLSMVQRIVEKCDGRIWVESNGTGNGSCFKFTQPGALNQ